MKINGVQLDKPENCVIVIPRQSGDIVIEAQAVLDYSDFDKLATSPQAEVRTLPGGATQTMIEEPKYKEAIDIWAHQKLDWMVLKSLEATTVLEWDTVTAGDPATWNNYHAELATAFSPYEVQMIIDLIYGACGLDQTKIDEATKSFLADRAKAQSV